MADLSIFVDQYVSQYVSRALNSGGRALEQRVVHAAQRVEGTVRRAALLALVGLIGAGLLLVAWFTACESLEGYLALRWSPSVAQLTLSGIHLTMGLLVLAASIHLGRRRPRARRRRAA